jgi:hypothetical protein
MLGVSLAGIEERRNLRERDHLKVPSIVWMIILKWIFGKRNVGCGLDRSGSGQGKVAGTWYCGNELSSFINVGKFLTSCALVSFSRKILLYVFR